MFNKLKKPKVKYSDLLLSPPLISPVSLMMNVGPIKSKIRWCITLFIKHRDDKTTKAIFGN